VTTHFYKGFGLRAEAEEMARAADFTRRAHARGIRVLGYHQFSTVIYETLLDEIPNLRDWIQRAPDGSLQTYGSATWRWRACPIHDAFIAYLKARDRRLPDRSRHGRGGVRRHQLRLLVRQLHGGLPSILDRPSSRAARALRHPHFRHVQIPPRFDSKDAFWQEWVRSGST